MSMDDTITNGNTVYHNGQHLVAGGQIMKTLDKFTTEGSMPRYA